MATRKHKGKKAVKSRTSAKSSKPKPTRPPKFDKGKAVFENGRWRQGGRFIGSPTSAQVRRDKAGRAIDAKGRRVPAWAIRGEEKRLAKLALSKTFGKYLPQRIRPFEEEEEKPKRPVKTPKAPKAPKATGPIMVRPGTAVVEKELVSSFFENRKPPTEAGDVLQSFVDSAAKRGPFEVWDLTLLSYGVKFVGKDPLTPEQLETLHGMLPRGWQLKFSDTRAGTEVYVVVPTPKGNNIEQAVKKLNDRKEIGQIYRELIDYWGSLDWYVWAEMDEVLY